MNSKDLVSFLRDRGCEVDASLSLQPIGHRKFPCDVDSLLQGRQFLEGEMLHQLLVLHRHSLHENSQQLELAESIAWSQFFDLARLAHDGCSKRTHVELVPSIVAW